MMKLEDTTPDSQAENMGKERLFSVHNYKTIFCKLVKILLPLK